MRIGSILKRDEVIAVRLEIVHLINKNFSAARHIIEHESLKLASQSDRVMSNISEGWSPHEIALVIIENVVMKILLGGRYHRFRGELDYEGHVLLGVFDRCIDLLIANDYCKIAEGESIRNEFKINLACSG